MANRAAEINDAASLPLSSNADAGYGDVVRLTRMTREFERAGVACIQLEDPTIPKKCRSKPGRGVVPMQELVGKIKAFLDARIDVWAADGLNAAVGRMNAYREAGA